MEDLVNMVAKAVEIGSEASVCAACILVAEAIAIVEGVISIIEPQVAGAAMLLFAGLMFVVQQLHQRFTIARNARRMLIVSIAVIILGVVLQGCVGIDKVPYFPHDGFTYHLGMIAGVLLIIAGIAGIMSSRTTKSLMEMMGLSESSEETWSRKQ